MTKSNSVNAGRIAGVFGLRGECKIDATRAGADTMRAGSSVDVRLADGSHRRLRIRSVRMHKGRPLAAFEGILDADRAHELVDATLSVDRDDVALGPGEYLDIDLIGCAVHDAAGLGVGTVVGVEHYPAQDMLVLEPSGALVPLVHAFVHSIDLPARRINVELPPGLLDEREADSS